MFKNSQSPVFYFVVGALWFTAALIQVFQEGFGAASAVIYGIAAVLFFTIGIVFAVKRHKKTPKANN